MFDSASAVDLVSSIQGVYYKKGLTMKKAMENRYPHSAELFRFCKQVLDNKYQNTRVIDQDIGQILNYDPADCSHWKKGRKNIKSIYAIKRLSEHLEVDEKILFDIVSGESDMQEAMFEYTGYKSFSIDPKLKEVARKDFYRKDPRNWSREKEENLFKQFNVERSKIHDAVAKVYEKINFSEVPLYLPEVMSYYPELTLEPADKPVDEVARIQKLGDGRIVISHTNGPMKPYIRYAIARELGKYFLYKEGELDLSAKQQKLSPLQEAETSLFAGKLLIPTKQLQEVVKTMAIKKDILLQLADLFWVSKTLMSLRFKDYIEFGD